MKRFTEALIKGC